MSVDSLISDARNFAASALDSARAELSSASSALLNISSNAEAALPSLGTIDTGGMLFTPAMPPVLLAHDLAFPSEMSAPDDPATIPDPLEGVGDLPAFNIANPQLNLDMPKPSQLAPFNTVAPTVDLSGYDFPTAPVLLTSAFTMPTLSNAAIPASPTVSVPALQMSTLAATPTMTADLPVAMEETYRNIAPSMMIVLNSEIDNALAKFNPQYHEQLNALEGRLTKYMAGGTALSSAVENAIYERTRGKSDAEYRRTRDQVYGEAAKRGFTVPSGALMSSVQQARQSAADNNSRAAAEIAIKQAELEQQNIQFAMTTSSQLRTAVMNAAISYHQNMVAINGQAMSYAKEVVGALVEMYNGQVRAYTASLEGAKAEVALFDVKLRASLAPLEVYKTQIQALESVSHMDMAKIGAYKAQIESLQASAAVYRAQIDAVVSKANFEKIKLEAFSAQVQAYSAQTQAKNAEWMGYKSAVEGEEAKARVFAAQVQAYNSQVQAWRTKVDGKNEQVKAIAISNEAVSRNYATRVSGYSAVVNATAQKSSAVIENQRLLVNAYSAANSAAIASAQAHAERYRALTTVAHQTAQMELTKLIEGQRLKVEVARAVGANAVQAGSVYGQLSSAALSGMTTLVMQSSQV
jgi:hypothetical protein